MIPAFVLLEMQGRQVLIAEAAEKRGLRTVVPCHERRVRADEGRARRRPAAEGVTRLGHTPRGSASLGDEPPLICARHLIAELAAS